MSKINDLLKELADELDKAEAAFDGYDFDQAEVTEIARQYWALKGRYDDAKAISSRCYALYNRMDKGIFPAQLEKRGMDMIRVPEMGRSFSIRTNTSASMKDKEAGMQWLREHGLEDLIQETVNAGTLASTARSLMLEQGIELPEDYFEVRTYNSMGTAKYTPKEGM